jgi:cobalt-zinc-cadmium efflux system outer membrane protein
MFSLLLAAVLIPGCSARNQRASLGDAYPVAKKVELLSAVESAPAEKSDVGKTPEPNGTITLRQALPLALMHNPELRAFSWDVRVSEAGRLQASLWPNPELEAEMEEVGGGGQRRGLDGAETTIQLSQLIELADKRGKRMKVASLEKELAEWDYEAMRLNVFTKVAKAFMEVLAAQQRLKLSEELLRLSESKAAVALSNVKIQHQQAVHNLNFARQQLVSTWAGKKPLFESAVGQLDSLSPIPSMDKLIGLIKQSPDIARWSAEIDKSKAALELEKAKSVSDVTLSGGLQRFNKTDDNAVVFGISIGLPIFDRNQAAKLAAAYKLAQAREQQRAAHNRIQIELAKAYQLLSNAYTEATELSKSVLQRAESVFEASKTGYRQGKLDYLNVLDAQRTLFEAKAQYVDAIASFHAARTDVERLIGRPINSVTPSKSEDRR